MKENVSQEFWNGSRPPFGYCAVEAGRRGVKIKKALVIIEPEAEVVHRIFAIYLGIEGQQYGIEAIVKQLNAESVRFRGKPFATSNVHRILTQETYAGSQWFNVKEAKSGKIRPRSEWVAMDVPSIIERALFDQVQAEHVFQPDRLTELLKSYLDQCQDAEHGLRQRLGRLKAELTETDGAIQQLLDLQSFGRYGVPHDVVYGPGAPLGYSAPGAIDVPRGLGCVRARERRPQRGST
jgi:hypothetical protein